MPITDLKLGEPRLSAASCKTQAQIEEACQIQRNVWGAANMHNAYLVAQITATNRVADCLNDLWNLVNAAENYPTQSGLSEPDGN